MPIPYTTLNARVKQKLATEAYWLSIEDELGVIFEGEQAFVYSEEGVAVNFKIGDGTKKFSELPYFIAYYSNVINQKVLSFLDQTDNITISGQFRNKSLLTDLVFLNNTGSDITLKVGTTDGGNEVCEVILSDGANTIGLKEYFTSAETLYFTGLTGADFSLFVLYIQLDEAPVIPPSGGGATSPYVYGTFYPFIPCYEGHTEATWDFLTGLAITGTPYEGCALAGTNGLPTLENMYIVGYKTGDTIGGNKGATNHTIIQTIGQLAKHKVKLFLNYVNGLDQDTPTGTDPVARARARATQHLNYEISTGRGSAEFIADPNNYVGVSAYVGNSDPINIQPYSKVALYFSKLPS